MSLNRTIAAVSTPYGRGGIAVIRVSGDDAVNIANKMFHPKNGKALFDQRERVSVYGDILFGNEVIDDGIAVIFKAPRSYTGEDTVEISCHGGILLTERVLSSVLACGAVSAEAGEFTKRAFINGRLELSKAEAVIGLIDAQTDAQLKLAASHASGVLKNTVEEYRQELLNIVSSAYVCIDYPDEDLEELDTTEMEKRLSDLLEKMKKTLSTYGEGKAVCEGIDTVILGKPNAGKSSLLNRLLGEERAIVTDVAGTTRDLIEEKLSIGRIILNICDTAGIRDTEDKVERIGVERALERAEKAELVLAVFDGSRPIDDEDMRLGEDICRLLNENTQKKSIVLINKSDKFSGFQSISCGKCGNSEPEEPKPKRRGNSPKVELNESGFDRWKLENSVLGGLEDKVREDMKILEISAIGGEGIEELKNTIEKMFVSGELDYSSVAVIANARQYASLASSKEAVERAIEALKNGYGADICGMDIEDAISHLGEIDGRTVTEDITDQIFHRFCVGK